MAQCEVCEREMTTADGCIPTVYVLKNRKRVLPVPYAGGWGGGPGEEDRCHDCNCKVGQFHHNGCDVERCPICGCQAIGCGCLEGAKLYEVKL